MRITRPRVPRMISPTSSPAAPASPRKGGQPGNRNAAKNGEARDCMLVVRCMTGDKSKWVKAANRAARLGELEHVEKSVLAAWVIQTLNRAVK